ncbi:MAG: pitrilysin family protein [Candidatus Pacebacteria bacterium]|nr:pitrilysin family protein [Candidatus Paceibacterota bacterium]
MMYKKTKLKNGIRIIKVPNRNIETVTLVAIFGVGSRDEVGKMEGVAHFLEHMMLKGTEKRPTGTDISKELDNVGAANNAFTGKEYTGYWIQTEKKDISLALDMLSDMLLHSKFEEQEIENEKDAVIEEINMYEDAPMRDIPSVFENMLYQGQSLGHDQLGSKENVKNFCRQDLVDFYCKNYREDNLIITVSGNFDERKVDREIKKLFVSFEKHPQKAKVLKNIDAQEKPKVFVKYKKTDQTNFSLGFRAFKTGHKDQYALDVLNVILAGNSSSRLYEKIREKNGLAYYIYSYAEDFQDVGYFTIQSGVGNDKCKKAILMIMEEIRRIKDEKVSPQEIERAKNHIRGRMAISLESSSSLASFITSQELLNGKILTPKEKFAKINAVTTKDLQRVAKNIFIEKGLNLAIIGPFRDGKKFEKLLKL